MCELAGWAGGSSSGRGRRQRVVPGEPENLTAGTLGIVLGSAESPRTVTSFLFSRTMLAAMQGWKGRRTR